MGRPGLCTGQLLAGFRTGQEAGVCVQGSRSTNGGTLTPQDRSHSSYSPSLHVEAALGVLVGEVRRAETKVVSRAGHLSPAGTQLKQWPQGWFQEDPASQPLPPRGAHSWAQWPCCGHDNRGLCADHGPRSWGSKSFLKGRLGPIPGLLKLPAPNTSSQ